MSYVYSGISLYHSFVIPDGICFRILQNCASIVASLSCFGFMTMSCNSDSSCIVKPILNFIIRGSRKKCVEIWALSSSVHLIFEFGEWGMKLDWESDFMWIMETSVHGCSEREGYVASWYALSGGSMDVYFMYGHKDKHRQRHARAHT